MTLQLQPQGFNNHIGAVSFWLFGMENSSLRGGGGKQGKIVAAHSENPCCGCIIERAGVCDGGPPVPAAGRCQPTSRQLLQQYWGPSTTGCSPYHPSLHNQFLLEIFFLGVSLVFALICRNRYWYRFWVDEIRWSQLISAPGPPMQMLPRPWVQFQHPPCNSVM